MRPSAAALKTAASTVAWILAGSMLALWLDGEWGLLGLVLGVIAGLPVALNTRERRWQVGIALLMGGGAAAGLMAAPWPWIAVFIVFVAGLLQAPLNVRPAARVAPPDVG